MDITNYPKELGANIEFRLELLKACEADKELQLMVNELCKRNPILWIDLFCYTKDPRRQPSVMPWICYDEYQEAYIRKVFRAIEEEFDMLTEKSRDMGASWMVLYVIAHKWLYEDGSDFRVGSRKEEFVDKPKVIDTLFEKLRFTIEYLPEWMLPRKYNWKIDSTYMKLHNPDLGNTIIGESANTNFGSGGRSKAILLDEFSKWDTTTAESAWTSTADVTNCRLPVSTPVGAGNKFGVLANGHKEKIKVSTLHWTLHPRKAKGVFYVDVEGNEIPLKPGEEAYSKWKELRGKSIAGLKGGRVRSPWYNAEAERRSESDLAQEVDIDYLKSGHPFFDVLELEQQVSWEYYQRKSPTEKIPYGKYIRVNLVDVDNKIKILERPDGWLKIFELPVPDSQFALGSDTSEGLPKGDESFGIVLNKWTLDTVATICGLIPPEDFAYKLWLIERLYYSANNAPENNNHGYTVCKELNDLGSNLFFTHKEESRSGDEEVTTKRGWTTSGKTRRPALDQMAEEIRKHATELRDPDLIAECKTFVRNDKRGEPEADGSFLDDAVMARAITGAVIKLKPYKAKKSRNRLKSAGHKLKKKRNAGMSFSNS